MQRVGILNGENITYDHDLTAPFLGIIEDGIIEGLEVREGKVTPGKALIKVKRSNGKEFFVVFESLNELEIDTTGTKKVFVEIDQAKIDDGSKNNEDGTGIGEIKIVHEYPLKNALRLASIDDGVIANDGAKIKLNSQILGSSDLINLTKEGNTFNLANKLVKLDEDGKLPVLDGSKLKNLTSNPFFLGNGNDGSLVVTSGETKVLEGNRIYNFADVNIEEGGVLTINENTGNLYIKCTGKFTNNGLIDGNYKNYPNYFSPIFSFLSQVKHGIPGMAGSGGNGGPYSQNAGRPGGKGGSGVSGFGGGGGGGVVSSVTSGNAMGKPGEDGPSSKGGNGGTAGSSYPGGTGGQTYGEKGGDGNGGGAGGAGGESGKSGANIVIYALEISGSGTISVNGSNGGNGGNGGNSGQYKYGGGGGGGGGAGGAGGSVLIISKNSNSYQITNVAGNGGKGGTGGSYGGKRGVDGLSGTAGEVKYVNISNLGAEPLSNFNTGEEIISKIDGSGTSFNLRAPDDAIKVIFNCSGGQGTLYRNKITETSFLLNGRGGNSASWSGEYISFRLGSSSNVVAYFFK